MNYTDVDDKIIIKARRKRLLELEKEKPYSPEQIRDLVFKAFQAYAASNLPLLADSTQLVLDEKNYEERKTAAYGRVLSGGTISGEGKPSDAEAKIKMHLNNMDAASKSLVNNAGFEGAEEILLPYLDSLYKETIDTGDQTIFTDLTQAMEKAFTNDMEALNVLPPDAVTRVTEYVPQIVSFVGQIVQNGFAYEANGSVYFDIAAFEKAGNTYARLRPESKNDKALQEEGEGSLSKGLEGKKRSGDFALWKKSKPGEPYWPSPWGLGRPGWHIECSAMASDKLGEQMDVHSGGIDLAFPHHDNELAQSEAYFHQCDKGGHTWVNYFLHMGHLSIAGSKMSKSLKNFQTIQDALTKKDYTARNMRIVFLMGRWNDGVEISPDMRKQANNWEETLDKFFTNVKARLAEAEAPTDGIKDLSLTEGSPKGLTDELEQAQKDLTTALSNSFDTPGAMQVILRLVKDANIYMNDKSTSGNLEAIESVARWVTKIVGIFGLDAGAQPPYNGLGWSSASAASAANADPKVAIKPYAAAYSKVKEDVKALNLSETSAQIKTLLDQDTSDADFSELEKSGEKNLEKLALPYLRATSRLRDELRSREFLATLESSTKQAVLALSDRIRDYDLTDLGVQLDDQDNKPSLIKFVLAEKLIAAREDKLRLEADKERKKEEGKCYAGLFLLNVLCTDPLFLQLGEPRRRPKRRSGQRPKFLLKKCSRVIASIRSGIRMAYPPSWLMVPSFPRARPRSSRRTGTGRRNCMMNTSSSLAAKHKLY